MSSCGIFCSYIALAELFFLQDRRDLSKMYWTEARETMFALYVEGPESVLCAHGSPEFQVRSEKLFRRMVRLLFCYDCEFIEKVCAGMASLFCDC